ncbi:MAG TPA: CheR family methyltransferase [Actinomycetota bacterium]|nr:CheR family methyltransferase [Actinomycetota bacterium]
MSAVPSDLLTTTDVLRFRDLVRDASGMELPEFRRTELARAISRTLERTGLSGPSALYQHLRQPDARVDLEAFVAELTIGETYFFRHRAQWTALEQTILPELMERRADERRLRLWSAACASGEEPYSLAMLLDRMIPDRSRWNISILATDINRRSLEKAHRGVYGAWSFRSQGLEHEERYFTRVGERYRISAHIREMVTFTYLNLVEDAYPSIATDTQAMDLIVCRNVLIYFGPDAANLVAGRLFDSLADGGWFVPGPADAPTPAFRTLEVHSMPRTILYRKVKPAFVPPVFPPASAAAASPPVPLAPPRLVPVPEQKPAERGAAGDDAPETAPTPEPAPDQLEALALWRSGRSEEALERLGMLAESAPADPWSPYLAAKICANERRLDQAARWVERSLSTNALFAPAHYLHGMILAESGDLRAATDAVRRAVYLDSDFVLAEFVIAGMFARLGEIDRAIKAIDNVTQAVAVWDRDRPVPEGDGLTAGRLLELATVQRELFVAERDGDDGGVDDV